MKICDLHTLLLHRKKNRIHARKSDNRKLHDGCKFERKYSMNVQPRLFFLPPCSTTKRSVRISVKALRVGDMRTSGPRQFMISLLLLSNVLIKLPIRFTYSTYFCVYFHFSALIFPAQRPLNRHCHSQPTRVRLLHVDLPTRGFCSPCVRTAKSILLCCKSPSFLSLFLALMYHNTL